MRLLCILHRLDESTADRSTQLMPATDRIVRLFNQIHRHQVGAAVARQATKMGVTGSGAGLAPLVEIYDCDERFSSLRY